MEYTLSRNGGNASLFCLHDNFAFFALSIAYNIILNSEDAIEAKWANHNYEIIRNNTKIVTILEFTVC